MGDNWYGAASSGVRSSVKDLVKPYGGYMEDFNDEFDGDTSSFKGLTFKQLTHMMSGKILFD